MPRVKRSSPLLHQHRGGGSGEVSPALSINRTRRLPKSLRREPAGPPIAMTQVNCNRADDPIKDNFGIEHSPSAPLGAPPPPDPRVPEHSPARLGSVTTSRRARGRALRTGGRRWLPGAHGRSHRDETILRPAVRVRTTGAMFAQCVKRSERPRRAFGYLWARRWGANPRLRPR